MYNLFDREPATDSGADESAVSLRNRASHEAATEEKVEVKKNKGLFFAFKNVLGVSKIAQQGGNTFCTSLMV